MRDRLSFETTFYPMGLEIGGHIFKDSYNFNFDANFM